MDERAKRLKLTRNRFVIEALKKALAERETSWSPEFVQGVAGGSVAAPDAVAEMLRAIKDKRSSKKAPRL